MRRPYTVTASGLYRTWVRHPVTRRRLQITGRNAAEVVSRAEHLRGLARELGTSLLCPHCGAELIARVTPEGAAAEAARAVALNAYAPERRRTTVLECWIRYETASAREHRSKLRAVWTHQIEPFGLAPLAFVDLDRHRGARWLEALAREGYSERTARNALWLLAACYRRAAAARLVPDRALPWEGLKTPRPAPSPRRRVLSAAEVVAIAGALGGIATQRGRLVLFAALTGLRNGELAALGWDDLDLDAGTVNVRHQTIDQWRTHYPGKVRPDFAVKGRGEHSQKLHPQAREVLAIQKLVLRQKGQLEPRGPVWPDKRGRYKDNGSALRPETLQRAAQRAGLDPRGIFAHALRHTCVSWEIRAGADLLSTQARIGHQSVRTTADSYAHPEHLPPSRIPLLPIAIGLPVRAPSPGARRPRAALESDGAGAADPPEVGKGTSPAASLPHASTKGDPP